MKNFKKMILIDLDGTLLNSRSTISKKNQAMLRKLIKLNYAVFIATGRNYKEALELTSNIEGLAYITTNGSYIVDFEGNVIFNNSIDQSLLAPLIKNLEKYNGLSYYLSSADKIFAKNKYKILKNLLLIDGIKELFSVDSIFRLIN
ncbi:MAG: HAD family phosphatase, partial [Halanaerobium sp. MSAO_Bac5]